MVDEYYISPGPAACLRLMIFRQTLFRGVLLIPNSVCRGTCNDQTTMYQFSNKIVKCTFCPKVHYFYTLKCNTNYYCLHCLPNLGFRCFFKLVLSQDCHQHHLDFHEGKPHPHAVARALSKRHVAEVGLSCLLHGSKPNIK